MAAQSQSRECSADECKVVSAFSCRRMLKGPAAALCYRCFVLWLVLALASQSSFAQAGLGDWQNVRNLAVDSNISVKTKAGEKYHGDLVNVTTDSLTLDSDERGFPERLAPGPGAGGAIGKAGSLVIGWRGHRSWCWRRDWGGAGICRKVE